jgi:glycosyltransferase involved in cell wall biosynthesis
MTDEESLTLAGREIALVANTSWYLYKFRANTIKALRERGAKVLCVAPPDDTSCRLATDLGAEYIRFGLDLNGANPLKELFSFIRLLTILARRRPHFVFNFTIKPNIYSGIACRLLRLPFANNVTGLGLTLTAKGLFARFIGGLYGLSNRGAARVFVQNPDDLAFLRRKRRLGRAAVTEIPGSGVDLDRFSARDPAPSPLTFLMIARLQVDKGVHEFVAAARRVRRRHPHARFVLLGSSEHANRMAITDDSVSEWRREGVVELPGHSADVRPWLAECHALVLPSHGGEGVPRVILEAAASARPAIVSDVSGCRHAVVAGRTGYICPPKNAEALADAMERFAALSEEDRNAMGRAARTLAEERYSEEIVIGAYLDCLALLATSSSRPR